MSEYKNIGLLFNKHYFRQDPFRIFDFKNLDSNNNKELLKYKNEILFASKIESDYIPKIESDLQTIELQTIYPGLFSGSGYAHESSVEGELKLGFFFDYTSGLPCLPGSSVKGVLRDACTKDRGGYVKWIISELTSGERESKVKEDAGKINETVFSFINTEKKNKEGKTIYEGSEFIKAVFEAPENTSIYNRDIFFDAFPISDNGKLLGNDYITPHKDPLKNPIPLQFMKVMPQVEFQFNFKLTDNGIPAIVKLELFKQILLDLGIGAKTNVGYGQFTDEPAKKNNEKNTESDDSDYNPDKTKSNQPQSKFEESFHFSVIGHLTKESIFKGTITKIDQNYVYVDFIVNNITCQIRKQNKVIRDSNNEKLIDTDVVKVLDKVNITVKKDYSYNDNLNCQVSLLVK